MTPGFHSNIDEVTYHGDRTSLSVSGAKTLLRAPALFKWQQDHPVFKAVFDVGSAAHALVLGRGMDNVYVAPFDNWQTKAAQTERKLARDDGLSPVLPAEWLTVCHMAEVLAKHRLAMDLLSEGEPEVSAYAPDETTGVMRRCRFDWLAPTILSDYKTAVTSEPNAFGRAAASFSYHMQHAWYIDVARDLGHPAEAFAFIVQEREPPYLVSVVELEPAAVERGRELNRRALERFRDCTDSGLWPGYLPDDTYTTVALPRWAYYDNELETA